MKRDGSPIPVTQAQLLQFENEFGRYVKVDKMLIESADGQLKVPGGYYLSECLHQLRICDGVLLAPPTDPRAIYLSRKLFVKCLAMEAHARYERAKNKLKAGAIETLTKPTRKQIEFVRNLKTAAQEAMNVYQEFLQPEIQKREILEKHKNNERFRKQDVEQEVEALNL
jgi:hypothetical protein